MDNSRDQHLQQQIDKYIKGELSEEEIQTLWAEFMKNPDLLDDLEIEVNVREILRKQVQENKVEEHSTKGAQKIRSLPSWTWKAAATAAIILVAIVQLFKTEPSVPLEKMLVSTITPENIEIANGVRSNEFSTNSADSLLNEGFAKLVKDDYQLAMDIYQRVLELYPRDPFIAKANFNIGLIEYNQGNYEAAIASFKKVLDRAEDKTMIKEKAIWFMGNAQVKTGDLDAARRSMIETYQMEGLFERRAFKILVRLNKKLGYPESENPPPPGE